jgi:hypothetical protein
MNGQLSSKRLAVKTPFEGFCHHSIVVLNKSQYFSFEFLDGNEVASFDHLVVLSPFRLHFVLFWSFFEQFPR